MLATHVAWCAWCWAWVARSRMALAPPEGHLYRGKVQLRGKAGGEGRGRGVQLLNAVVIGDCSKILLVLVLVLLQHPATLEQAPQLGLSVSSNVTHAKHLHTPLDPTCCAPPAHPLHRHRCLPACCAARGAHLPKRHVARAAEAPHQGL